MTDVIRKLGEYPGTETDTAQRIAKAASYAGHASAMAANLYAAGRTEKADVWLAEQDAWAQRQDALIESVPLGKRGLMQYAAETACARFDADTVRG